MISMIQDGMVAKANTRHTCKFVQLICLLGLYPIIFVLRPLRSRVYGPVSRQQCVGRGVFNPKQAYFYAQSV